MKGNPGVIEALLKALAGEFAAGPQYQAHQGAFDFAGFLGISAAIDDRGEDERRHASMLIARLIELESLPAATVGQIDLAPGDLAAAIGFDGSAEDRAIEDYAALAKAAADAGDGTTNLLALTIGKEEAEHRREISGWQQQIALTGLDNFLSAHVAKGA